jgi:hypothetical protein
VSSLVKQRSTHLASGVQNQSRNKLWGALPPAKIFLLLRCQLNHL